MGTETPLLAFAWTFAIAVAVGAVVSKWVWGYRDWPRTLSFAFGLAMARAVIVFFDPPFLVEVLILAVLLGSASALARLLFPRKPEADGGGQG